MKTLNINPAVSTGLVNGHVNSEITEMGFEHRGEKRKL